MVELAAFTTSPPLVMRIEVVADSPNTPCVHASYAVRPLPVSSTPSQRSALPVMVEQNTGQVVPVIPPKERPPEILRLVVVALVEVARVNTPVLGVVAPIGVLLIVPPEMVRSSSTCAFDAEPVSDEKAIPRDEVASCWYEPPAYVPRSIPAAVGDAIPVPPPPAVKSPAR